MSKNPDEEKNLPDPKSEEKTGMNQLVYIYDPKTDEWKVHNPSGSLAYNYLSRDEWAWLD